MSSETTNGSAPADVPSGEQLQQKLNELKQDLQQVGQLLKSVAQEKLEVIRDAASQRVRQGRAKTVQVEGSVEEYIRAKPVRSVLIAAGIGAILSAVLRR